MIIYDVQWAFLHPKLIFIVNPHKNQTGHGIKKRADIKILLFF
ncbi:hypothetical protein B4144_2240 [Bacillus atrophaeus]|nr:hypothetical protein B4144_2240 [Bacillus atrophaeus]